MSSLDKQAKPIVLIVGAGLGGLMLGALLEKCSISYLIIERAPIVKPLGSAISVGCGLIPAFQQLGIFEKLVPLANRPTTSFVYQEPRGYLYSLDWSAINELYQIKSAKLDMFTSTFYFQSGGHGSRIVSRPLLYGLLLDLIPSQKILFTKRVQAIDEKDNRTQSLDPEKYPEVKAIGQLFVTTLGSNKPYSWVLFATSNQSISWMVVEHLDKYTNKTAERDRAGDDANSEWGPNAAQAACDKTRQFAIPFGVGEKTLGDLYDQTPKELISKVSLEEKVFETWFSGRIVLLRDDMTFTDFLPAAAGQGAVTSMHDAIALANLLYSLPSNTNEAIETCLREYQGERIIPAISAYKSSQMIAKVMEKGIVGRLTLYISKYLPAWIWNNFVLKPGCI
ncbi:hypothetical protein FBU30_007450 [Linnemannia zychae]|nr:hypothetical protein FBU30_007450 [Linnemannia zychae]